MPRQLYGREAIKELERYLVSLGKLTPKEKKRIVSLAEQAQSVKNREGVVITLVSG